MAFFLGKKERLDLDSCHLLIVIISSMLVSSLHGYKVTHTRSLPSGSTCSQRDKVVRADTHTSKQQDDNINRH